jgi:hypothetical protein
VKNKVTVSEASTAADPGGRGRIGVAIGVVVLAVAVSVGSSRTGKRDVGVAAVGQRSEQGVPVAPVDLDIGGAGAVTASAALVTVPPTSPVTPSTTLVARLAITMSTTTPRPSAPTVVKTPATATTTTIPDRPPEPSTTTTVQPTTTTTRTTTTVVPARTVTLTSATGPYGTVVTLQGEGCAGPDYGVILSERDPSGQEIPGTGGSTQPDGTWQLSESFNQSQPPGDYTFAASCVTSTSTPVFAYAPAIFHWTG